VGYFTSRPIATAIIGILAASGCASQTAPSSGVPNSVAPQIGGVAAGSMRPVDSTSILEKLTKQITIGSTVDPENGDQGPRSVAISTGSLQGKIAKGQLLVCNYEDSSGTPGNGTTMEVLSPKSNSSPSRFIQTSLLKGCDGDAIQPRHGSIWGTGFSSGDIVELAPKGKIVKTYTSGKVFSAPFSDTVADHTQDFGPLNVYVGSTLAGGIVNISAGFYGNGIATQVAKGFAVGKGSDADLGPSGLAYDLNADVLYIVDGVDNTVVAFTNASKLVAKDEIVVEAGGTTFKCKFPKTTCGKLIYSGSPLDAPIAATLLPNGNLIVANSQGTANTLVELTPAGTVLATKVVDSSATQGVFGLAAKGTNDNNTVLYFTDVNSNTVEELEQ
jgi:hypothetical protein